MFHRPLVYQGVVRVENKVLVGVCRLPLDGDLVGSISQYCDTQFEEW